MKTKTKNRILVLVIALVLFLCYRFAIVNTLELRTKYKEMSKGQLLLKDAPDQLALLAKKQSYYDSVLNKMNLGDTAMENNLLRVINLEAEKNSLKVIDFNEPHISMDDNNQRNTFDFTLEGNFTALLKTIYVLEQKNNFGEVVHLHFQRNKNYRTNKNYLTARVFLQHID